MFVGANLSGPNSHLRFKSNRFLHLWMTSPMKPRYLETSCLSLAQKKNQDSGHISLSIPGRRGASPLSLAWTKPSSQVLQGSALQGCEAPLREVWPWAIIITSIVTKIFILIIRSVQPQSQPQSAGQQPRQEEPATNQHYWTFSGQRTCWPG